MLSKIQRHLTFARHSKQYQSYNGSIVTRFQLQQRGYLGIDIGSQSTRVAACVKGSDQPTLIETINDRNIGNGIIHLRTIHNDSDRVFEQITIGRAKTFLCSLFQNIAEIEKNYKDQHFIDETDIWQQRVVAVPDDFDDKQRKLIKDTANEANFPITRLINASTSATLAYGFLDVKPSQNTDRIIAVLDCGATSLDSTIINVIDGMSEILSKNSNQSVSGNQFDQILIGLIQDKLISNHKIDFRLLYNSTNIANIENVALKAKLQLDKQMSTDIKVVLEFPNSCHESYEIKLDRQEYEKMSQDLINGVIDDCEKCIIDAQLTNKSDITDLLLIGGMSNMPKIREIAESIFERKANKNVNLNDANVTIHPCEAIALGAAINSTIMYTKQIYEVYNELPKIYIDTTNGQQLSAKHGQNMIHAKFCTTEDNQTEMVVSIRSQSDFQVISKLKIDNLTPRKSGETQILVMVDIDREFEELIVHGVELGKPNATYVTQHMETRILA